MNAILGQTTLGKAYEYACLLTLYELVSGVCAVKIVQNSSLDVAKGYWNQLPDTTKEEMHQSALAGLQKLLDLEPKIMESGDDNLEILLQMDSRGQQGDVRDLLIIRRSLNWEIGISVKHNHEAVKHSRLSPTIDFGKEWFNLPCTQQYFADIRPVFSLTDALKASGTKWSELPEKNAKIYIPLLRAFMNEIRRLDEVNPEMLPARLLEYLLGRYDFYKLIAYDDTRTTRLQCFNLRGTLNTAAALADPKAKVERIALPRFIHHLDFSRGVSGGHSETTIDLVMDANWAVTLRIHSASTNVESSLKFDIQLTGVPAKLFNFSTHW